MLIEDTNGKKVIFGNVDFPHIKSILKKCFKNMSLFFVLAFKILHTEKVTFLKVIKNGFLSLDCFLEVLWLWKHVEKMCWKISFFFIKSKFWYDQLSTFYLDATVVGFYWDSTVVWVQKRPHNTIPDFHLLWICCGFPQWQRVLLDRHIIP